MSPWQVFRRVVLPLIGPSLVGVSLFGFTMSWDEIARSLQAIGDTNALPPEPQWLAGTVTMPEIHALRTLTPGVSVLVMGLSFAAIALPRRVRAARQAAGGEPPAVSAGPACPARPESCPWGSA